MPQEEVARLQEQIRTLFGNVDELKENIKEIRGDIKEIKEQLANRLPLWATVIMSTITGTIGWLISRM